MKHAELKYLRLTTFVHGSLEPILQREAADLLGISPNHYAKMERGVVSIPLPIAKLARLVLGRIVTQEDFDT